MRNIALFVLCIVYPFVSFSQYNPFKGKKVGVYISSKQFLFDPTYYMDIAQFLKVEIDRSQGENVKKELLVRMGELFSQELQRVSQADTCYFINGDPDKGRTFIKAFNAEYNSLTPLGASFADTDYVLILNEFSLENRFSNSLYIYSNKMFNKKVRVRVGELLITTFDVKGNFPIFQKESCLDEHQKEKPELSMDFLQKDSALGNFLSLLFSQFWMQVQTGEDSSCSN